MITQLKEHSIKTYGLLFIAFFIATFLIYLPTVNAKFVADAIDMAFFIPNHPSLLNFSHGIRYDVVFRAVFQGWLHVFGYNVWAWHFLQCALHSFIAVMLYAFTRFILIHFQYAHSSILSLVVSACFLVSPYHTEPIVWVGDLNYVLVGSFIFIHLLSFVFFLQNPKKRYALIAMLALIAGMFTHELGWFLLPADFILALSLAPSRRSIFTGSNLKFWIISVVIMGLYFINKVIEGELIGHYGSATHLRFHLNEMVPAFYKYILKIIGLSGFTLGGYINPVYTWMDSSKGVLVLTGALVLSALLLLWRIKKSSRIKAFICFFLLFAIFVFPVLNLYFPFWIKIEADRYCYVTSAFLIASAIIALYSLRPVLAWVFSLVYFMASVYFLSCNIESWHQAGTIMASLETEYHWKNAPHVYILNIPDDYRGAYMYRSLRNPNAFAESFIKYGNDLPKEDKTIAVLGYNLDTPHDSVSVQVTGENQLKVTICGLNSWFWRKAGGASDYEDEFVEVHISGYPASYTARFKQKQPGDVFLYSANGHWRQVMNF